MRLDCRQRKAMLLTSVLRRQNMDFAGAGVPSGTPPFNGARYLDTTTGVVYLGRNVLNFNASAYITIPAVTNARSVRLRFKTSNLTPANTAPLVDGTSPNLYTALNTGNARIIGAANTQLNLNGSNIASNAVSPISGAWNVLTTTATDGIDKQLARIGVNAGFTFRVDATIANVEILGIGDTILRSYAINEGSGTTIFDSSGNGQHGTLTIGSGSWELVWMPMDQNLIVGNGPPTGTPSITGLDYLDLTNNVRHRSRNVLNFNTSASIAIPEITNARKILAKYRTSVSAPAQNINIWRDDSARANAMILTREITTGFLRQVFATPSQLQLNGVTIANNTTNTPTGQFNLITDIRSVDSIVNRIGRNGTQQLDGVLCDVQILGAGDVLLANYAINEGSGTTIIDSVSGQNGTLTIGSGSWELTWVPQN